MDEDFEDFEPITKLYGVPPCPLCNKQLDLRSMPDTGETHWHCTGCGTQWEVMELIEALEQNRRLALQIGG